MRKWRERFSLYISSFSLYFLPLSPFPYQKLSHLFAKCQIRHFCRKCHKKLRILNLVKGVWKACLLLWQMAALGFEHSCQWNTFNLRREHGAPVWSLQMHFEKENVHLCDIFWEVCNRVLFVDICNRFNLHDICWGHVSTVDVFLVLL